LNNLANWQILGLRRGAHSWSAISAALHVPHTSAHAHKPCAQCITARKSSGPELSFNCCCQNCLTHAAAAAAGALRRAQCSRTCATGQCRVWQQRANRAINTLPLSHTSAYACPLHVSKYAPDMR
jgi:hypothetical protein